jgi:hypothetical protein
MDLRFRSVKRMFVMRPIKKHDPRHGRDYAAKSSDEPSSSHVYPRENRAQKLERGKGVNNTTRGLGLMPELGQKRKPLPEHLLPAY